MLFNNMSKTTKSFEKVSLLNYCVANKLAENVNGSKVCARAEVENPHPQFNWGEDLEPQTDPDIPTFQSGSSGLRPTNFYKRTNLEEYFRTKNKSVRPK